MSKRQKQLYEFGRFALDTSNRLLLHEGEVVPLHPKAFDLLLLLVERSGQVLEKDELMQRLWPDSFVEDANLSQNIYVLRKALGQETNGAEYIKTIAKRGYRFVADVNEVRSEETELVVEEHTRTRVITEEEVNDQGDSWRRLPADSVMRVSGTLDEGGGATETLERRPAEILTPRTTLPPHTARWGKREAIVACFLLLATVVTTLVVYSFLKRRAAGPFQKMKISRLTDIGKALFPAISPDGKYLAYTLRNEGNEQSIWVKHIPTGSTTKVVPPAEDTVDEYEALIFSPDGSYIFYSRRLKGVNTLYKVPVLGGPPRKLIDDIWGRITFSPDGQRLAFIRAASWNTGKLEMIVANTDGTGEYVLASRKAPDYFNVFGIGPAWSPDGKIIACSGGNSDGGGGYIVLVRVNDGSQTPFSIQRWDSIGQIAWLADGSGLVVAASEGPSSPSQLWQVSYPAGEANKITNDLNDYQMVSLTADSSLLVAQQDHIISNIWLTEQADTSIAAQPGIQDIRFPFDAERATQLTSGVSKRDGFYGIAWTPDGRIVYSSDAKDSRDLWSSSPDGSQQKQFTVDSGTVNVYPAVSPDGRYVVFSSNRGGERNIWRVDADGRNPLRLTTGKEESRPSFSADGRWVFYQSGTSILQVWKVSIEGGAAVQLTHKYSSGSPVASPDGKLIAYSYFDEQGSPPWRLGVMPVAGEPPIKSFPDAFRCFRWSPDGSALTYIVGTNTFSNIWSQPLDGGPPRQLTDFKEKRIYWFDWSRDGKRLALARGESNYDVVMISDFK